MKPSVRFVILDFMILNNIIESEEDLYIIVENSREDATIRNRALSELYSRNPEKATRLIKNIVNDPFENMNTRAVFLSQLATSDDPKLVIEEERLTEVRVVVEDTIWDIIAGGLITMISIGIFSPTSWVVEGNRGPPPEQTNLVPQS